MPNDLEEPGAVRAGMARPRAVFVAIFALVLIALAVLCATSASAAGPTVVMHDLGPFSGQSLSVSDLSSSGVVVGSGEVRLEGQHAFFATAAAGFADAGFLIAASPSTSAGLQAINGSGLAVGYSSSSVTVDGDAKDFHAVTWTEAGGMADLGTLGGSTSAAADVSENGQIVGSSNAPGFCSRAITVNENGMITGTS